MINGLILRSTIAERIASLIRQRVHEGTLRAGTLLREEDLSRELDVMLRMQ